MRCTQRYVPWPPAPDGAGCPVQAAQALVEAALERDCGRNALCHDALAQLRAILSALAAFEAAPEEAALLEEIARSMLDGADCELAEETARRLLALMAARAEDFSAHALQKRCAPAARRTAAKRPRIAGQADGSLEAEADICVVGGGMSGLTAAIAAAEAGRSVCVIEKGGTVGGAANMGMGFFAVESRHQKAQLVNHTVDGLFREFMDYTHWRVNAPLVKKLFSMSASTVDWIEGMGVEFLGAYKYFEDSNQTWHIVKTPGSGRPAERCAGVMIKAMKDRADALGVHFAFHTAAEKLEQAPDGRVCGVLARTGEGRPLRLRCGAVVVGTGGFGDNPDMIRERIGLNWAEDLFSFRIPGLRGDGIRMIEAAGGATEPSMIEVTYTTPGVTDVFKTLSETMRQPNLMVNRDGRRIIDESIMNNTTFTGNAISIQPGRKAFTVLTDSVLEEYRAQGSLDYITVHHNIRTLDGWETELAAYFAGGASDSAGLRELQAAMGAERHFFMADSLEALCREAGIDALRMRSTVAAYNAMAGRYDAEFNKHPRFMRALKDGGRWYAAAHYMCGYGTLAGVKTDADLAVLDTAARPIPGLYGCGTDVCAIFGDSYNFKMPGSTMGFAINSGRLAGMNAASSL
ncbi:MAG: FAD-dependent oxidoreductase [Clostridia bacterium]|nr:FAD-dependent oxidoreductase [Clostridia bacterium]